MSAHWWVELVLGPIVGLAVSGGVYWLKKSLGSLSADGSDCIPALLLVWLESSQHWSLQGVG